MYTVSLITSDLKTLILGMAIAIIAGTALGALGYPTPLLDPSLQFTATSYKEEITRKVKPPILAF